MAALDVMGGIFQPAEWTGFRDYLDYRLEQTSVLGFFTMKEEHSIRRSPREERNQSLFWTSAFSLLTRQALAVHFPGKIDGAAYESQGHAAGVIVAKSVPLKAFLFVASALLAGKPRPFLANGVVKALTIVAAEHFSPYLVATFHSHVAFWFSPIHDRLLKLLGPCLLVPKIVPRTLN
jgi:hypothetical protein